MSICYVMLCQGGTSCVHIDKTSIVRLLLVLIFVKGGGCRDEMGRVDILPSIVLGWGEGK